MRGIVYYCVGDGCRKPLLRDAYLRIGSRMSVRCFSCGSVVKFHSVEGGVERSVVDKPLPDKSKDAIVEKEDEGSCFVII